MLRNLRKWWRRSAAPKFEVKPRGPDGWLPDVKPGMPAEEFAALLRTLKLERSTP